MFPKFDAGKNTIKRILVTFLSIPGSPIHGCRPNCIRQSAPITAAQNMTRVWRNPSPCRHARMKGPVNDTPVALSNACLSILTQTKTWHGMPHAVRGGWSVTLAFFMGTAANAARNWVYKSSRLQGCPNYTLALTPQRANQSWHQYYVFMHWKH